MEAVGGARGVRQAPRCPLPPDGGGPGGGRRRGRRRGPGGRGGRWWPRPGRWWWHRPAGPGSGWCRGLPRPRPTSPTAAWPPAPSRAALIEDPATAGRRAVALARDGGTEATDGTWTAVEAETLCIHGDHDRCGGDRPGGARRPRVRGDRREVVRSAPGRRPRRAGRPGDADRHPGRAVTATVAAFGDTALLAEVGELAAAHGLVARIEAERAAGRAPAAVGEPVVGLGNVVVHLHPDRGTPETVEAWLRDLVAESRRPAHPTGRAGHRWSIPVVFDGPDLGEVARALGHRRRRGGGAAVRVGPAGGLPGIRPRLPLPGRTAPRPRRRYPGGPRPRSSVPAGSVAVAGGFASVYPQATPGGWMLLGTHRRLPVRPGPAPLRPVAGRGHGALRRGARPRARAAVSATPDGSVRPRPPGRDRPLLANRSRRFAEVVEPGLLSLVQDLGRRATRRPRRAPGPVRPIPRPCGWPTGWWAIPTARRPSR